MNKSAGFTLIELIIVIVLIGILAAIAIPRFINQTANARIAALNGLVGALNSSAALGQAEYRAEGNSATSASTTATMDGTPVVVLAGSGFPDSTADGIGVAARNMQGFTGNYAGGSGATADFDFANGAITNCNVVYSATGATVGTAAAVTSGC